MEIRITGRKMSISQRTHEFVTERVEKLLRYWERVSSIHVTLGREGNGHTVEILLSAEHKHDFVAKAAEENVLAALDQAVAKLERQLAKYKNKIMGRRKTTAETEPRTEPEEDLETAAELADLDEPDLEIEEASASE